MIERAGQFIQKTLLAWLVLFSAASLFWTAIGLADPFLWTMGRMPQPCGVANYGSKIDVIDLVDWVGGLGMA